MRVSVKHDLAKDAALKRVKNLLDALQRQYKTYLGDVKGEWVGDVLTFSLTVAGLPTHGTGMVGEREIVVSGELPLPAVVLRGRIEQIISDELNKLVA
jgi:hypothetical protein